MITTDTVLRRSIEGGGDDRIFTLDPAFSGLPDAAHGGTVLAAFDAVAGGAGARALTGRYHRRVPLGVPLALRITRAGAATVLALVDAGGARLVDGRAEPLPAFAGGDSAPPRGAGAGAPLPVSRTCFVCGVDNPLGLRARLVFDERAVWTTWAPDERLCGGDGAPATIAVTGLLDEAAFWLGALATGESGMTTELRVALHEPPVGALTVSGDRAAVVPRAGDARYRDTRVEARDARGRLVASATITFVAVRGAARRLVSWIADNNPSDVVRSVFPAYTR
jgi:acyl-coenzyme A thioesterase PaaI-like protein